MARREEARGRLPHSETHLACGDLVSSGRGNLQQVFACSKTVERKVDLAVRAASTKLLFTEHERLIASGSATRVEDPHAERHRQDGIGSPACPGKSEETREPDRRD